MTADGRLFPVPEPDADAEPDALTASYGSRLTARNRVAIANGRHPATRKKLLRIVDPPQRAMCCGDCAHADYRPGGTRWFWKCRLHPQGMTHGPATDIRISWPACELFDRAPKPAPGISRNAYDTPADEGA